MIAASMMQGIKRVGDEPYLCLRLNYSQAHSGHYDVAVFYGLMREILDGYRNAGKKAIYVDLGYWGRHEGGRRSGFHKVSINSRHPTSYFQQVKHAGDRFDHFRVPVLPPKKAKDGYIMLAGMSAKAAAAESFGPEQWERSAIAEIRKHTDREIIYRPKPNWHDARALPGTKMIKGQDGDVHQYLNNCHAVVTHHSNVALDAVLYGVPAFSWDGISTVMGSNDLSKIEKPPLPDLDVRRQFAADAAYTQFNVQEIIEGVAWRHLKDEGLVP